MPMLIATLIIGGVSGWLASRRIAVTITGVAAAVTLVAFLRAATDGRGDDPAWIIPEAIIVCGIALALAWFLPARRSRAAA
jgi:hypothetical protein